MNTYGVDLMGRRRRRQHTAEFKAAVIEECLKPGVSIAAVALAHGLNANMLRKWVIDAEHKVITAPPSVASGPEPAAMPPPTFIPLALPAATVDGEIRIELQRAGTTIKLVWPASAARDCAAWLSDWLR
jgi:transposase